MNLDVIHSSTLLPARLLSHKTLQCLFDALYHLRLKARVLCVLVQGIAARIELPMQRTINEGQM